jgi:hypothetical protein
MKHLEPQEEGQFSQESSNKVAWVPDHYVCNRAAIPAQTFIRERNKVLSHLNLS